MKSILWLGLLLTSSSWLYLIPIFNSPDEKIGIILLILGTICNIIGFWKSKTIYFKERYLILFIPLILSIYLVPFPFNIGIILFTIGFVFSALIRRISLGDKTNMIFKGISLTGFILIVHATFFFLYQIFVSHGHRADIFSPIISHLGNLLGLKTSVNNGIVFIQTTLETYPFIMTWEKLGFFIWFNIFIGSLILFILFHRKRKILFDILIFLIISALYLIFRCIIFIHFYINTLELEIFWNPWYMLLSYLPLALLLMKILQLKNEDNRKKTILVLKLSKNNIIAMLLIFIFIFSIVGTLTFQDSGSIKKGRVIIDEFHSDWEDSTKPLDKEWYGVLSTYNYYSWAEWLNYYYTIKRNLNNTLTVGLLDNYDILILKCPTNPYSDEEINAIIKFVEHGGGLFLIGDHTNVFGMNTYLNTVANKFGISFKTDATYELGTGALSSYNPSDMFSHPIVNNLNQFDFMTSCTLDAPFFSENVILGNRLITEPGTYSTENFFSESIATTESEFGYFLQSVAIKHGKGRVVAFTDSTVFSSFSVFTDGYQTYSLGVFDYLNRENVYSYINILLLGIGIVSIILLIYSIRKEHKLKIASLILFIGLLSFSIATPIFSYNNTVNYQLPTTHTDFTQLCFVQEHSNIKISLEPSILIEKEENEFGTFFVWTQRIGCVPSFETTLNEAVKKADIIVFINPIKTFSNNDIDLISKFIENGGKMLVMDSITNSLSTSNELISNFGMWINKKSDNLQLFDNISGIGENNSKGIIVSPYLSISGGEKTIIDERNETQIGVMNFYNERTGKNGTIVVVVDSYTFRDQNMGGVFTEPNDEQLKIYDTEFLILEELLKTKK